MSGPSGTTPAPAGRCVIGLSTYREPARWGVWDTSADLLPSGYTRAVESAGGAPVLLPPAGYPESAAVVVARIDGLVICGGADVDPRRYGAAPHPRTSGWREDRDAWELALLDAAEAVALPTLGVCRGMQLMAVRAGGCLHQHTPDVVGRDTHRPGDAAYGDVEVVTAPGSLVRRLMGERRLVHCHHHQSVAAHPGFDGTAWAGDGTVEAMEQPGDRFCLGVQWHPEVAKDAGLFRALVDAAADYRAQA